MHNQQLFAHFCADENGLKAVQSMDTEWFNCSTTVYRKILLLLLSLIILNNCIRYPFKTSYFSFSY